MMNKADRRFEALDCLRGFAAIAVVWFHTYDGGSFLRSGILAVDLFFILSGFVIAFTYGERVLVAPKDFLVRRFIRLYPMLFLGAAGGIALAVIHNFTNPAARHDYSTIAASGLLSLFTLPYLNQAELGVPVFSFNPPIWSLFFEILANIGYAMFARHLSVRVLFALVVAGLLGVLFFGPLGGGEKAAILSGIPRVTVGFFGGVLLFKLWKAGRLPRFQAPAWALVAVVLVLLMLPVGTAGLYVLPAYAVLFTVVIAAINSQPTRADAPLVFLGLVSYPVYLTHWLTLYVFSYAATKLGLVGERYIVVAIAHILATPFMGWMLLKYYEEPARRWLSQLRHRGAVRQASHA